jgi:leucyl aminopeptidase
VRRRRKLKLPVNIVAFAALAENMPGPKAMRPGDIYFTRNGTSVEIMNTDAEGRLVLADALCLATEEKPRAIIDVATLTGAIVAALGNLHSGLFTRSPELLQALESASELTGEKIWRLPLTEDHEDDVKGQTADITNQCTYTGAGSATAAAFLAQFVPQSIPWAHLDIAGTAQDVGQRLPYSPKNGASGVMVRTLVQIAESHLCKAATVRCVS